MIKYEVKVTLEVDEEWDFLNRSSFIKDVRPLLAEFVKGKMREYHNPTPGKEILVVKDTLSLTEIENKEKSVL